jgi:hypothetical protein
VPYAVSNLNNVHITFAFPSTHHKSNEASLSRDVNVTQLVKEIPGILWRPKVHLHIHKPNTDLCPEQSSPSHAISFISVLIFSYIHRSSYEHFVCSSAMCPTHLAHSPLVSNILFSIPFSNTCKSSLYLFLAIVEKDLPLELV